MPGANDIAEFASLLLRRDADAASSYLADLRARGAKAEALYLDLLAPAARHLGDLWDEDICSFTEVTTGLLRMQQMLHELRGRPEITESGALQPAWVTDSRGSTSSLPGMDDRRQPDSRALRGTFPAPERARASPVGCE